MIIFRKKLSDIEKWFYLLWIFFSFFYFMCNATEFRYMYDLREVMNMVSYITILGLCFLFFLKNKFSSKVIVKYFLFFVLVIFIEIIITDKKFLVYVLFIMLAQFIDFKKFISFDIKLKLGILLMIIGMCSIGIIDNYSALINGSYKQALGFSHPNTFCCFAFTIIVEWMYTRFERMSIKEYIIIFIFFNIIRYTGASRTVSIAFIIVYSLTIISKIIPKIFDLKIIKCAFMFVMPIIVFISFKITYMYLEGNAFALSIDEALTHRIRFQAYFLSKYKIKLLGQNIELIGTRISQINGKDRAILDNAYIKCVLQYGIIFMLIICIVYMVFFYKTLKNKKIGLAIFGLFFVILGFGESYTIDVVYNLTMLYLLSLNNLNEKDLNYDKSIIDDKITAVNNKG